MSEEPKTGRPPHEPTEATRERVQRCRATGMSQTMIAGALRISVPTLLKYYAEELEHGLGAQRVVIVDQMFENAKGGNATIQKYLHDQMLVLSAEQAITEQQAPSKPARLGKKEEADITAQTAGLDTGWGSDLLIPVSRA